MTVRIVREAGGIGDVVRIFPALRALHRSNPSDDIYLYAPPEFRDLYEHAGVPFLFVPTPMGGRRPRGAPLDESRWPCLAPPAGVKFDRSIDLYCPAFDYEATQGREVEKDRIQVFCEAAGVWPCDALPRYFVRDEEDRDARRWLAQVFRKAAPGPLVGLQPFSTDRARDWPEKYWVCLANGLEDAGCRVVVIDGCVGRTRRFGRPRCVGKSIAFSAAVIAACDVMITPDSGLFHMAAAVDTRALGLFASQPGDVIARHYPLACVLTPEARRLPGVFDRCSWPTPCVWRRPPECSRAQLAAAGRTCAALASVEPPRVLSAALALLSPR